MLLSRKLFEVVFQKPLVMPTSTTVFEALSGRILALLLEVNFLLRKLLGIMANFNPSGNNSGTL